MFFSIKSDNPNKLILPAIYFHPKIEIYGKFCQEIY